MVSLQMAVMAFAVWGSGQEESVLLDFYADWCIPCRQMEPAVQQLVARGYPVRRVNFDQNRALAAKYGVDRLPSFVMLVDGQVADRVVGGTTFSRLERMCTMARASRPEAAPSSQWAPSAEPGSDRRPANAGWSPTAGAAQSPVDDLIAATVRLRIEDADGQSCGSGTIIDARGGEALILTCGHIFRDSKGRGRIEVDLFGPTPAKRVPGCLLSYDLESDIGLVTIRTPGPVTAARVAPAGYRVAKGDRVINVGCNNGEQPTARHSRVTSLDKYLGPPNLQVAGLPVQGRSGGGLFSADGLVIGVCNAADPSDNEGLYTALAAVHEELDQANLVFVYGSGDDGSAPRASLAAVDPPAMPKQMPRSSDVAQVMDAPTRSSEDGADGRASDRQRRLSGEEQAALEEIRRRRSEGAEVVCVIRSRSQPQGPSEIIVLDDASPAFLARLAAEAKTGRHQARHLTSLEISKRAQTTHGPAATAGNVPSGSKTLLEYHAERPSNAGPSACPSWQASLP